MLLKIASPAGGLLVGYWFLSESLINHSKTSIVTKEDSQNERLTRKILNRHNTMKNWLNVDMTHAKRHV